MTNIADGVRSISNFLDVSNGEFVYTSWREAKLFEIYR